MMTAEDTERLISLLCDDYLAGLLAEDLSVPIIHPRARRD